MLLAERIPSNEMQLSFSEAVGRFRAFLAGQGWPATIVWVRDSSVVQAIGSPVAVGSVESDHEVAAVNEYDAAIRNRLGVCFHALCTIDGQTCATVLWPVDEDEAERLMYPSDGGLKLSVALHDRTAGRYPSERRGQKSVPTS